MENIKSDADRDKLNLAAVLGWRVLRFSPQMIARNPDQCVAQIRAALEGETHD
jgi:very-short-patch-repair endonuclease